ncbi:MAG: hypothetical protein ABSE51_22750 [Terracidiphilus sp.]
MSGKLDRAIAEAERESQSQELAAEVYARERRALDEQIPAVWVKLKAATRLKCDAKPKYLRFVVCVDTEAKIERLNDPEHRMLEMQLLRESGIVAFSCGEASGCFTIRLNRQNIARVCDQNGGAFASLEDAADEVLSLLFI